MGSIRMTFDDTVTESEKEILHERRDLFLNGYGNRPLFWDAIPIRNERYFRIFTTEGRGTCLAMIPAKIALTKDPTLLRSDIASDREFKPFDIR